MIPQKHNIWQHLKIQNPATLAPSDSEGDIAATLDEFPRCIMCGQAAGDHLCYFCEADVCQRCVRSCPEPGCLRVACCRAHVAVHRHLNHTVANDTEDSEERDIFRRHACGHICSHCGWQCCARPKGHPNGPMLATGLGIMDFSQTTDCQCAQQINYRTGFREESCTLTVPQPSSSSSSSSSSRTHVQQPNGCQGDNEETPLRGDRNGTSSCV